MDLILWSNDIAAALQYVQNTLQQLLEGSIGKDLLVIRRELKKRPADYATPSPHSVVAAKMQKLNPETAPTLGERVPFVISQGSLDISQRAEPPDTPDLVIDTQYYLEHQLRNPVVEIFSAAGYQKDIVKLFHLYSNKIQLKKANQPPITNFFTSSND